MTRLEREVGACRLALAVVGAGVSWGLVGDAESAPHLTLVAAHCAVAVVALVRPSGAWAYGDVAFAVALSASSLSRSVPFHYYGIFSLVSVAIAAGSRQAMLALGAMCASYLVLRAAFSFTPPLELTDIQRALYVLAVGGIVLVLSRERDYAFRRAARDRAASIVYEALRQFGSPAELCTRLGVRPAVCVDCGSACCDCPRCGGAAGGRCFDCRASA
jgi:hypothetical protein